MARNVFAMLESAASTWPDRVAVIDEHGEMTFAALHAEAVTLREALVERGLAAGQGLGVLARNGRGFIIACFAGLGAGAVVMPLFHQTRRAELVAQLAQTPLHAILDDRAREDLLPQHGELLAYRWGTLRWTRLSADPSTPFVPHLPDAAFVRHTSGVICAALPGDRCDKLALPLMVPPDANADQFRTAFTVTVDLAVGTTTGISAADRAATLRALASPATRPADLNRPGHIFPLRARPGGVIERPGHTEAAVDLARLAGRLPAGVLSEVVLDDGRMARLPDLQAFARTHGLPLISIADLITHRRQHELAVTH